MQGIGFSENARPQPISCVVRTARSVGSRRNKCSTETGTRQLDDSREKDANRPDWRSLPSRLVIALITSITVVTCQLAEPYLFAANRCATCAMGMMGMFKWLRKDITHRERNGWNLVQKQCTLNNESYRNALQAFIERRQCFDEVETDNASYKPNRTRAADLVAKSNNKESENECKLQSVLRGVPYVTASEIFEVGWIAGTEDRYLELIFAEWHNTRVSLKRHVHPDCKDAVKADLDVLLGIPHPNVVLLMGVTQTDEHGLVSIFESVDCTLYHYIHEQGERISIQSIAKCVGRLSDALRHSHVLGYVHSAISSHCVYLASSGIVKLGGWELAMHIDTPKQNREYEERLRSEIFRWQAPELFHDYKPRKESDVYGLAMLIWEMCTMQVPWKGYSKVDVERQYVQRKCGVTICSYDFPPLLYNLLEAGLQVDVNKRTLDMNRMRRFLQRLEMQYEDEEPVYVDQLANNNNESGKTYILPMRPSSAMAKSEGSKLAKSASTKQQFVSNNSESPTKQYLIPTKSKPKGNVRNTLHIEPTNIFYRDSEQKNMNVLHNIQNKYKKTNCSHCKLDVENTVQNEDTNSLESFHQPYDAYKKTTASQDSSNSWNTSVHTPLSWETTDDESFKDAIATSKLLKKDLANKREHFFYGSDSSQTPSNQVDLNTKENIPVHVISRNYEPHKPASHKTSIQPKYNKSPGQYDSSCMKSSSHQYRKIPYCHVPMPIKKVIAQPQVLNSDPQSFFETSLWRKEKLICLAKMRKSYGDESMTYCVQNRDNTPVSTGTFIRNTTVDSTSSATFTKNTTVDSTSAATFKRNTTIDSTSSATFTRNTTIDSISSATFTRNTTIDSTSSPAFTEKTTEGSNSLKTDSTYILNQQPQETETSHERYIAVSEDTYNSPNSTLQVLKDALDRATKIVRSTTPNSDASCSSPTFKTYEDFEVSLDESSSPKSMFEELYKLHMTNENEEIKMIEKSTPSDTFLFSKEDTNQRITEETDNDEAAKKSEIDVTIDTTNYDNQTQSFNETYTRNFVCESILEVSSELSSSYSDTKQEKTDLKDPSEITYTPQRTEQTSSKTEKCPRKNEEKSNESNDHLLFINDSVKAKNCNSCHQRDLSRRRSLPATLSQLRLANSAVLGKLPIRRGDVPDNTIEDLYIDDEFGNDLNVNMVLLSTADNIMYDLSDLNITKE